MKATVKYNNVFVTSAYDIETLKKVKKFRPEALVLSLIHISEPTRH